MGSRTYPRPTPASLTHTIPGTQSVHCASLFRLTPRVPLTSLRHPPVLRTVQASLECSMVVNPCFLPSFKRWQWSPLLLGLLPFSVRSRSVWCCPVTTANSFPSYTRLCLPLIAHDHSCSWVVLGWFRTSNACVAKAYFQKENTHQPAFFLLGFSLPSSPPRLLYSSILRQHL